MFDSICLGRNDFLGGTIDFGRLAEALVFYRQVHFLADRETFASLVRTCGIDVVLELSDLGALHIHYSENLTAVGTLDISTPAERHALAIIKGQHQNFLTDATQFLDSYCGSSGKGRSKTLRQFTRIVESFEHSAELLDHVRLDLLDPTYIRASVGGILASLAADYAPPDPLVFDITRGADGFFRVTTNVDFAAANVSYHRRVIPEHSTLSPAFLIAQLLGTRASLEAASRLSADLCLGPVSSVIGANKIASLIKAHENNTAARQHFTEMVIGNARAIGDAVTSGERNFADVLKLVKAGQKFKEWLKNQNQSFDLYQEYCREVTRVAWADKLPPKAMRWLLINAANIAVGATTSPPIALAIGSVLSAADSFLLDRLLNGWRPNQFVDGPLRDFVKVD
ncbi:MAG: hypothetical protein KGL02_03150 [Acidobacteriota bacterium]|nr:hypothetical protein [Acidobacteriota bacterium]